MNTITIYQGDNLKINSLLKTRFELIYIDPPFNTGRKQSRTQIKTTKNKDGDRTGYKGNRYQTIKLNTQSYQDKFDDYIEFIGPRLEQARDLLTANGSLFVHLDSREVHYVKVFLDRLFGRENFMNEIIWSYDYGARSKTKWSNKHDSILWYCKTHKHYCYNYNQIDRIPYLAPSLVGEEKAAIGKTPTDVWWHTIVSPNGKEKTGYPTQKPLGILNRIIKVHSNPNDQLLDFFAGSGSFGEAAYLLQRNVTLIDSNPQAIEVMLRRFEKYNYTFNKE